MKKKSFFLVIFCLFLSPLTAIEHAYVDSSNTTANKYTDIYVEFEIDWAWTIGGSIFVTFPPEFDLSLIPNNTALRYSDNGAVIEHLNVTVSGQRVTLTRDVNKNYQILGDVSFYLDSVGNPSYREKSGSLFIELENPGGLETAHTNRIPLNNYQERNDIIRHGCLVTHSSSNLIPLTLIFLTLILLAVNHFSKHRHQNFPS